MDFLRKNHNPVFINRIFIFLSMMDENEKKAHLSHVYVYAVATGAGFCYHKWDESNDRDSIDVTISCKGKVVETSHVYSPKLDLQLKATTNYDFDEGSNCFKFPIKMKNYNDLRNEERATPAILVVLILPPESSNWLKHSEEELIAKKCAYWTSLKGQPPSVNTENITISIPKANVFSPDTLTALMAEIYGNGSGVNAVG